FEEFGLDPLADFEDGGPPLASQGIAPSVSEGDGAAGGGLRGSSLSDPEDENGEKERRKKQEEEEEDDDENPQNEEEDEEDEDEDGEESYVYTIEDFICDDFDSPTSTTTTDDESDLEDSQEKRRKKKGGDQKVSSPQEEEEKMFDPLAWRRYRLSLRQNLKPAAFEIFMDMEKKLETLQASFGDKVSMEAIEKVLIKYLKRVFVEQMGGSIRHREDKLTDLNWTLVNKLGSAVHAISKHFGVILVHKIWVKRILIHNSLVYESLLLHLFNLIKSSPLFLHRKNSSLIQKVQESFEAWQRSGGGTAGGGPAGGTEETSSSSSSSSSFFQSNLGDLSQTLTGSHMHDSYTKTNQASSQEDSFLRGGGGGLSPSGLYSEKKQVQLMEKNMKEVELRNSPLYEYIGSIILDMAVIFHLRRNGFRDYVELGLGEEGDLLCELDKEQSFPQFLRDLLKEAVHKRYGREIKFTLTTSYFKAFINFLKTRHGVNLYERRARKFRELQFQTDLCRAASADTYQQSSLHLV
ncbi:hypothetical protein CSUI_010029, partial [Cystoisospora suis]